MNKRYVKYTGLSRALLRVLVTFWVTWALGTHAAELGRYESDIAFEHRKEQGKVYVTEDPKKDATDKPDAIESYGATMKITLRPTEEARLWFVDGNPLLFTYSLGEPTETNMEGYDAVLKLAEALKVGIGDTSTSEGARKALESTGKKYQKIKLSVGEKTIELNTGCSNMVLLAKAYSDIGAQIKASINTSASDLSLTAAADGWDEAENTLDFLDAVAFASVNQADVIIKMDNVITNVPVSILWEQGERWSPEAINDLHTLEALYHVRSEARKMFDQTMAFSKELAAYKLAKNGQFIGNISAKLEKRRSYKINVTPRKHDVAGLKAVLDQAKYSGSLTVDVVRRNWIEPRLGVGVIYSFVENPDYTTVQDTGTGTFKITEKTNEYNEFSGAVALNLYFQYFAKQAVDPFIQIGYSPGKDSQGFLLGIGATLYKKLNLAGGLIYQETSVLGGGQSVGDELAADTDLKVDTEFKSGLYLQFGLDF